MRPRALGNPPEKRAVCPAKAPGVPFRGLLPRRACHRNGVDLALPQNLLRRALRVLTAEKSFEGWAPDRGLRQHNWQSTTGMWQGKPAGGSAWLLPLTTANVPIRLAPDG